MRKEFYVKARDEAGQERIAFLVEADALRAGVLVNNTYRRFLPGTVMADLKKAIDDATKWAIAHHTDAQAIEKARQDEAAKLNARAKSDDDELVRKAVVQSRAKAKARKEDPARKR